MQIVPALDRDTRLLWLLHYTRHASYKLREKKMRKLGATGLENAIMIILHTAREPLRPTDISQKIFREPHTIHELLRRLERKGLIRLVKDLERKNWIRVEMTEKGSQLHNLLSEEEPAHKIMSALSEEEQEQLGSCLQKLLTKLLELLEFDTT